MMNIIRFFRIQIKDKIRFFKMAILLYKHRDKELFIDTLTGCLDRTLFEELAKREISRAKRYKHRLCLIIIDVDNLKEVNTEYGHLEGDEVLRKIAKVLRGESREVDILVRWGGDEFILVMPETKKSGPSLFAKRVSEELYKLSSSMTNKPSLSVTMGVTFWKKGLGLDVLIDKADDDLLKKKKKKKVWI